MKKSIVFLLMLCIVYPLSAELNDTLRVHPELNGWNTTKMEFDDNLAEDFWYMTIEATSSDPDSSQYLFMNWSWGNRWVGGSGDVNEVVDLTFYNYDPGVSNWITTSVTENYYYTFKFKDVGYNNTQGIVLETSASPVSITSVTQSPVADSVTNEDLVTVTVDISTAKCSEEYIYVRYSTDNWTSDNLEEVSFTGTQGTAEIPAQTEGTLVSYYVFSTTVANPTSNFDFITLAYDNNAGNNYTYTVGGKPKVVSADPYNEYLFDVTFSEAMDTTTTLDPTNYSITSSKKDVTVEDVSMITNQIYRVETTGFESNTLYTVTVDTTVTDSNGSHLDPNNNTASFTSYEYAPITFVIVDTANVRLTNCYLKGSWNKETGIYDATWGGGATEQMYDDGTHGDVTPNDHFWSRLKYLVADSTKTWEWGAEDQNNQWLIVGPNPQFFVKSDSVQTLQYILPWVNQTSRDVTVTFGVYMGNLNHLWYNNGVSIQGNVSPLNWNSGSNLMNDPDNDSLYTVDITFPQGSPYDVEYKFTRKDNDNNWSWENIANRSFAIDDSSPTQILDWVYWDDVMPVPQNVTIAVVGSDVNLTWDGVFGATDYGVYRSTDPYSGFTLIGNTGGVTNYQDSGAGDNYRAGKFFYQIKGVR
ncbi:MAG: Ig-like domain-containing protein [Candidatus Cloacimonetes bacterium]|nr:Ig-like domain-containing protein [Candidatus Cloacimonadota bacterium]